MTDIYEVEPIPFRSLNPPPAAVAKRERRRSLRRNRQRRHSEPFPESLHLNLQPLQRPRLQLRPRRPSSNSKSKSSNSWRSADRLVNGSTKPTLRT